MQDILTVTLNPALDLATSTPHVSAGPKLRCTAPSLEPGGGGINVSRAILHLGGGSRPLVALGGATGESIAELLAREGLSLIRAAAPGETRQSIAVTDQGTGGQYRFVLPGPVWSERDVAGFADTTLAHAQVGGFAVLSGSLPPGFPPDWMPRLAGQLRAKGTRAIADTSGAPLDSLAQAKGAPVFVLRMDSAEAEELAGRALPRREDSAAFARSLVQSGAATHVVIARGPDGSVSAGPDGHWHAEAADVPVRSKIGAGDSFVGGFTMALAQDASVPEALRAGAAAASAAVMTDGTELCRKEDADALRDVCALTRLPD